MADLTSELRHLEAHELVAGYASGALSPVEVVDACLGALEAAPAEASGTVTVVADRARSEAAESARRWREGTARMLEGVPFGAKDLLATEGVRTTLGSARWAAWVPDRDAASVARLRRAGAVLVAKLATSELGFGDARDGHRAVNPWAPEHWAGGSSTGPAVALALRHLPLALGTDTGGSIRVPASYCGVTGLKPTRGLVPTEGSARVSWTLDHVGPMARSARDAALALDALDPAGAEPLPGVQGLRVGVPDGWYGEVLDDVVRAARSEAAASLQGLGATLDTAVEVPDPALAGIAAWVVTVAEFAEVHADWRSHVEEYTGAAAERLAAGAAVAAGDYVRALRVRRAQQRELAAVLTSVDVLLTPGTPTPAPRIVPPLDPMFRDGDRMWLEAVARNLIGWNLLGAPAVVVPAGFTADGRPVSVQVVGRPGSDRQVLGVAAALQSASDHHRQAPTTAPEVATSIDAKGQPV